MALQLTEKGKKAVRELKQYYVFYEDFPKKGINFWDVFSLTKNKCAADLLHIVFEEYAASMRDKVDVVVGLEARGFVFAPLLAYMLKCTFIPIRKKGKLPGEVIFEKYALEYNEDVLEIQKNAISPGQRVIILDDCIATGGTMAAAYKLVEKCRGVVVDCMVLNNIPGIQSKTDNLKVTVMLE